MIVLKIKLKIFVFKKKKKTCPEPSLLGVCGSSQVDSNHHRTQEHQNGYAGVRGVRYTVVKGGKTPSAPAVRSMCVSPYRGLIVKGRVLTA